MGEISVESEFWLDRILTNILLIYLISELKIVLDVISFFFRTNHCNVQCTDLMVTAEGDGVSHPIVMFNFYALTMYAILDPNRYIDISNVQ